MGGSGRVGGSGGKKLVFFGVYLWHEQGSCAVYHNPGAPAKPAVARPGAQSSLLSVSALFI